MFSKAVITLHCVKSFEIWGVGSGGGGGRELSYNMGRLVSQYGTSCLCPSFYWGKLSLGELSLVQVVFNSNIIMTLPLPLRFTLTGAIT